MAPDGRVAGDVVSSRKVAVAPQSLIDGLAAILREENLNSNSRTAFERRRGRCAFWRILDFKFSSRPRSAKHSMNESVHRPPIKAACVGPCLPSPALLAI